MWGSRFPVQQWMVRGERRRADPAGAGCAPNGWRAWTSVLAWALAVFATLAAAPAVARVEIEGRSDVRFRWAPASGPVAGYMVRLQREGQPETHYAIVPEPEVEVRASFGDEFRIRVAAFDELGNEGPWSVMSSSVAVVLPALPPARPDPSAGDDDGDGLPDVAVRDVDDSTLGYARLGALPSRTEVELPWSGSGWRDLGHGDFDGDGATDVVWQRADYPWLVMTLGGVAPESRLLWPTVLGRASVAGVGDFDGDGRDDLLVRDVDAGELHIWYLEGIAVRGIDSVEVDPGPSWRVAGVADYDGDRQADILWRRAGIARLDVWPMEGSRLRFPLLLGEPAPASLRVLASADLDLDGRADVLLFDQATSEFEIRSLSAGRMAPTTRFDAPAPLTSEIVDVADYTIDGWPDLLVYDGLDHQLDVYRMLGTRFLHAWSLDAPLPAHRPLWPLPSSHPDHPLRPDPAAAIGLCPGDINGDGVVDAVDSRVVTECFQAPIMGLCALADLNGDGVVSNLDRLPMREYELQGCD